MTATVMIGRRNVPSGRQAVALSELEANALSKSSRNRGSGAH
jgi:hypothetical protein